MARPDGTEILPGSPFRRRRKIKSCLTHRRWSRGILPARRTIRKRLRSIKRGRLWNAENRMAGRSPGFWTDGELGRPKPSAPILGQKPIFAHQPPDHRRLRSHLLGGPRRLATPVHDQPYLLLLIGRRRVGTLSSFSGPHARLVAGQKASSITLGGTCEGGSRNSLWRRGSKHAQIHLPGPEGARTRQEGA